MSSASNNAAVATLHSSDYSLEEGVTTFSPSATAQASFVAVIDLVEQHHGEYSHDPPVSIIEVIGFEPSAVAVDELDAYGFHHVEPSNNGFVARRALA